MSKTPIRLLLAASALALAVTPALADNGKGKGKGHSSQASASAQSASGKSNHGALASELKGLNAAHASENALANASPDSQVGRIATYRDAALATQEKAAALQEAQDALAGMTPPARSSAEVQAEIDTLDPLADGYAEALALLEEEKAAAQVYEDAAGAVLTAQDEVDAAQATEDAALLEASDGRVLSDEALAYLRSLLNL